MTITYEINELSEFTAWSGAVQTKETILAHNKAKEFMFIVEDIFPDGCSETQLNDFLWFDTDFIYSALDIDAE